MLADRDLAKQTFLPHLNGLQTHQLQQREEHANQRLPGRYAHQQLFQANRAIFQRQPPMQVIDHLPDRDRVDHIPQVVEEMARRVDLNEEETTQMGKEAGTFDINTVLGKISEKLIRRHPHVFGDETASSAEEVIKNWEAIKAEEKRAAGKAKGLSEDVSILDGVSTKAPALMEARAEGRGPRAGCPQDRPPAPQARKGKNPARRRQPSARSRRVPSVPH